MDSYAVSAIALPVFPEVGIGFAMAALPTSAMMFRDHGFKRDAQH